MSVHRPMDVPVVSRELQRQDPQGLGKQLVYGVSELALATTMTAVAVIEGSAAVCSQFTSPNGQNLTSPVQGYCSTAETLSQATWMPTSYGLVPYVSTALALGVDGARRIYNVTKVGFQGVKQDGKKAWKIFKEKATSMNKKYPAMAAGLAAGFFTSGLSVATTAVGLGAYVAADIYNDYVGEPGSKEEESDSPPVQAASLGAEEFFTDGSAYAGADEVFSTRTTAFPLRRRNVGFHSAASAAPAADFFDAEAPVTGKIRVKIGGRTYSFSNIRAAFYAHRYPSEAGNFAQMNSAQAEAHATALPSRGVLQSASWTQDNKRTMYFVIGVRLQKDPAARAQLRGMGDAQIDQINTHFNGVGPILKQIRDWDKRRSTPVDDSYPRQVAGLAHTQDAL